MAHGPDTERLLEKLSKVRHKWYELWKTDTLDCSDMNSTSLPELPSGLLSLSCDNTQLSSLPELPSGLRTLYVSNTQLTSLPELPSELITLECYNTQLTSLPNLPSGLQQLYCFNTPLTSLPEHPARLWWLKCQNTPLILQRKENESIADNNQRWAIWSEEEESRKRIQAKHRLLKEEIVMEAWHPRKVERWIELGVELADL